MKNKRVYRNHSPLKTAVVVILFVLLVLVLLTASIFFGFQKYIVYDENGGLHLEVPWLEETMPDNTDEQSSSAANGTQENAGAENSGTNQEGTTPHSNTQNDKATQNNKPGAGENSTPDLLFFIRYVFSRTRPFFQPGRQAPPLLPVSPAPQQPVWHFVYCCPQRG